MPGLQEQVQVPVQNNMVPTFSILKPIFKTVTVLKVLEIPACGAIPGSRFHSDVDLGYRHSDWKL